jgi:hypothetical protein
MRICSTALIASLLGKTEPTTPSFIYNTYRKLISDGVIEPHLDSANQLTEEGKSLAKEIRDGRALKKYATSLVHISEKVLFASAMSYYTLMILHGEIEAPEVIRILDVICEVHDWDLRIIASSLFFMQSNGLK